MRATNRITAGFLRSAPVGKHCDGAGLWLVKREDGGAQWVLRVTVHGRRREMGLGGYPTLGLADARKLAARWRDLAAAGRDLVKERKAEERAARREDISLAVMTADAFEARKAELKGDGTAGRWLSPLALHVLPKLGKVGYCNLHSADGWGNLLDPVIARYAGLQPWGSLYSGRRSAQLRAFAPPSTLLGTENSCSADKIKQIRWRSARHLENIGGGGNEGEVWREL
jgi:hypothetical protein